ncbi:MAG: Uma2 family endonuclease [Leptolyngbyaceae cyanobacterium CSU_1_3]|nr:Uma2 family endonuclease [Leptolyngbyaceae cyanobacterium CSU_1_3]
MTSIQGRSLPLPESWSTGNLPTMYDLPSEDPTEPGLPDEFHDLQPQLLSRTLRLSHYTAQEMFSVSDMNLYYDPEHLNWYKRPDWFLVVGVPRRYRGKSSRSSYVLWDEKVSPAIVVEFLSPGTEPEDLGRFAPQPPIVKPGQPPCKFDVYEQIVQVQHYIVYHEETETLRYFRRVNLQFQEQPIADGNPRLWIPELEIGLGLWQGEFEGLPQAWLRWCDRAGQFFPTDTEAALASREIERRAKEQERRAKEQERRAKEQERRAREEAQAQVRQTAQNLLNLGMSIAQVSQITGLSQSQVQNLIAD